MTDGIGRVESIPRIVKPGKDRQDKGPSGNQSENHKVKSAGPRTSRWLQKAENREDSASAPKKDLYGAVQVGDEGIAHRTEEKGIERRWANQLGGVAQGLNHDEDSQEPKKAVVHATKQRGLPLRGAPPAFLELLELGF